MTDRPRLDPEHRDRANDYLRGMAARGFGATVEQAIEATRRYPDKETTPCR